MLPTTIAIIKKVLEVDPSITPIDRQKIIAGILNYEKNKCSQTEPKLTSETRILRLAEVARRLGVTVRTVHTLSNQGIVHKLKLPGRQRAWGFSSVEIENLINVSLGQHIAGDKM